MVMVADRLRESFWRVSSYMEGSAYAYAYAYVCKRARLLEQNVGLSTGFFGCVRKGHELAAAAAAAAGVNSLRGR